VTKRDKSKKPSLYVQGIPPVDEALRLYTATQAARVLGVHVNTVYQWLRDGTLKSRNCGGRHYIPRSELAHVGRPAP